MVEQELYKDKGWLINEIIVKKESICKISKKLNVTYNTIMYFSRGILYKFVIFSQYHFFARYKKI